MQVNCPAKTRIERGRWNYLLGFNREASKRWSLQAEAGFGGSRSNFVGSVTYRW